VGKETDPHSPQPPDRWFVAAATAVFVTGMILRLRQYAFGRSMWLDEAMLSVFVISRSFTELLAPLDQGQNGPILFLLIQKALTLTLGVSEFVLRAVPMVCGLLLLPLLASAGFALGGRSVSIAAMAIAALSPTLIRYANEAKPYGVDAMVTSLLILVGLKLGQEPTRGRFLLLALLAPIAALASIPAAFALLSLWPAPPIRFRHNRASLGALAAGCTAWAATLAAHYVWILGPAARDPRIKEIWRLAFLPPEASSLRAAPMGVWSAIYPVFSPEGPSSELSLRIGAALGIGLILAATALVCRRHGLFAGVLLAGPLAAAVVSSCLGLYPFGAPRLMVFNAPCLILLFAAGWSAFVSDLRPRLAGAATLAAATLLAAVMGPQAFRALRSPYVVEDGRGAYLAYLERSAGEPLYVSERAQPSWLFYALATRGALPTRIWFEPGYGVARRGDQSLAEVGLAGGELLGLPGRTRWVWPRPRPGRIAAGWKEQETRRILEILQGTRRACVWLLFSTEPTYGPLVESLATSGATVEREERFRGARLSRVCSAPGAGTSRRP